MAEEKPMTYLMRRYGSKEWTSKERAFTLSDVVESFGLKDNDRVYLELEILGSRMILRITNHLTAVEAIEVTEEEAKTHYQ